MRHSYTNAADAYNAPGTNMKIIGLRIDDEILDKVRIIAAHDRTTVSAMVQAYLAEVADRDEKQAQAKARQAEARKQPLRLMETSKGRMAPNWKFDREETHGRVRCENPFRSN